MPWQIQAVSGWKSCVRHRAEVPGICGAGPVFSICSSAVAKLNFCAADCTKGRKELQMRKGFKNGGLRIQPREKNITWASLGLEQTAVVGRRHICLEMTAARLPTPTGRGWLQPSSPPEGNKKGVCTPGWNFAGNGGIALLLAGEGGNFRSK